MRAFNLGCGPEVFEDGYKGYDKWRNIDSVYKHDNVENIDLRYDKPLIGEGYDFVLVNHVLCTMRPEEVDLFLMNAKQLLKPDGKIQVIDMDLLKAFNNYLTDDWSGVGVGDLGNKDAKLCMHVSGYGTRRSLYTPQRLVDLLEYIGFKSVSQLKESEFDTRPKESVIVEGVK